MTERFADTFFFLALLDPADSAHPAVRSHAEANDDFLVTTRWALAEVANATARFSDLRHAAALWLRELEADPQALVVNDSDLYMRGLCLYEQRPDKSWSLTDCTSFIVMEDRGMREALTADRHFSQAGFVAIFARDNSSAR